MTKSNKIVKKHKGYSFVFVKQKGIGYKVSAIGFGSYWFQSTTSVRLAIKNMQNYE